MPIIGREAPADIVIPAPQVSARHAEVWHIGDDRYQLVDLDSSNGTFVNGERIRSRTIRLDDDVRLGSFRVDLRPYAGLIPRVAQASVDGPAEQAPPPPAAPPAAEIDRSSAPPAADVAEPPRTKPFRDSAQLTVEPPASVPASVEVQASASRPEQAQPQQWAQPGMGTELAAALAAQKSYVGKAFLTWFLYWVLWLPGAIMNVVYWNEAKRTRQMTGESPSGMGCLLFLLITHLVLPGIGLLVLLITGGALLKEILDMF